MKPMTRSQYVEKHKVLLCVYAAYWGLDDQYDNLVTCSESDIQVAARRMLLELPETQSARTSSFYILGILAADQFKPV